MRSFRRIVVRIFAFLFSLVFTIVVLVVIAALVYDWNDLRGPIGRLASAALGRRVALNGDLDVDLGWKTRITLNDVALANADWAREPNMATVGKIDATVDVRKLLTGHIRIPSLVVEQPYVLLARTGDGRTNWTFGEEKEEKNESSGSARSKDRADIPVVEELTVSRGLMRFQQPGPSPDIDLQLDTFTLRQQPPDLDIRMEGTGLYQKQPFKLQLSAGPFAVLQSHSQPYPLDLYASAGDIMKTSISGTIGDPAKFQDLNLDIDFMGSNAADLFPLIGLALPPTPQYRVKGKLLRKGDALTLRNFEGSLGSSDIRGTVVVDFGGKRPLMKGDLTSNRLDLADLLPVTGAPREPTPEGGVQSSDRPGRVLPNKDIDLTRLRAMDADVSFRSERILTETIPLDRFSSKVTLEDGTLRLQPVSFGIGRGHIDLYMSLYGTRTPVHSDIDLRIQRLNLKDLMRNSSFVDEMAGILNGRIKLSTEGTSVADILGHADGQVYLIVSGGKMSLLLVELAGLDIAESLGLIISGEKKSTPIRCLVADMKATQGTFETDAMVFDTGDTIIIGTGSVNMADETLHMRIAPYAKDFSPLTLRTPISIGGTLASPDAFPDPIATGNETLGEKIISAILTPIIGLLPPFDTQEGHDADCSQLIERARQMRAKHAEK